MPYFRPHRVRVRTLLTATGAIAALLLTAVLLPQMAARNARLEVLRLHVDQVARLAASHVDGDLHRRLLAGDAGADELAQARAPLLRLHATLPEAFYVYTMSEIDGMAHFILDTAQDAEFAARRGLRASQYMEPFQQRSEFRDDWLQRLGRGEVYVTPGFQMDDYGLFLSGHAPIRDSGGVVAGFVGVDFALDYFLGQEARFRRIEIASGLFALLLALLLGYLYARHQHAQQAELRHHYRSSMQDSLTGLPNRRGALAAVSGMPPAPVAHTHAMLLVDIDNFKQINDTHGHRVGDEVLQALAAALDESMRPGDIAARLGGDEFLIFARDCGRDAAEQIAARLLDTVRRIDAPVRFSVSVGIGVAAGTQGGFDQQYHRADAALYRAKGEGRDRYVTDTG